MTGNIVHPLTQDFYNIYRGYEDGYGIYMLPTGDPKDPNEKRVGKAATKKGKLTLELWDAHLSGKQGLGVVPITSKSECKFGAIDIDQYPLDLVKLNEHIQKLALPLVLCRTKSGGAHLYLFATTFIAASVMVTALRSMAAQLGHGGSEIFPKQVKIIAERGDMGQWINMPYFSCDAQGMSERYGMNRDGQSMYADQFIQYVQGIMVNPVDLENHRPSVQQILEGGPPCLNQLIQTGFPQGTRNNGLMNLGVYAKKVNRDNWEAILEQLNQSYMDPPLTSVEVQGVIKSLKKKDYQYTCTVQPIQSYCDKVACKKCKYGVGNFDVGMPKFGTLTKIDTVPPIWFLDVEGGERLELSTEDLQTPLRFQKRCMEVLHIMPGMMKRDDWTGIVQRLLEKINVVEVPVSSTPKGRLLDFLENFCTSRVAGKSKDEVLLGKPFTENGWTHFRLQDFFAYLDRHRFTDLTKNFITLYLKDMDMRKGFWNIKGKGVSWVAIPEFKSKQTEEFEAPEQSKEEF